MCTQFCTSISNSNSHHNMMLNTYFLKSKIKAAVIPLLRHPDTLFPYVPPTKIQTLRLIMSDVNSEVVCFCLQGQERIRGQSLGSSEEIWQRLQPVVECGDDAMTLTVRRRRAVQLLLDRGEATASPFTNTPALSGTVTSVYIPF